jgi:hypothetical protein
MRIERIRSLRPLVQALALACLFSSGAEESAEAQPRPGVVLARLQYEGGGDWYNGPSTLPNLAKALRERTPVVVERLDEARVSAKDPELFNYPLLYMNGHGNVRFSDQELDRLRSYLLGGGFLFANDDYGMDTSFRREMARVFPDRELKPVPFDHPIYHSFYSFPRGLPKIHEHDNKTPQGLGIFDGERMMVFYAYETDIGDGLEDSDVHHDPTEKREAAMRMAINIVLYALTQSS